MSRQTDLEELVFHEATSVDGIVVLIRMGQDPGRDRMKRLIGALKELDEILRGQTVLDRRLAYAFWALASYTEQHVNSWAREGREWPPELVNQYFDEAEDREEDELGDMGLLRSVEGEGYWLHYLGGFEYEPRHG